MADERKRPGMHAAQLVITVPPACTELWGTFLQLSRARRSGMSAQALTLVDVQAWCQLHGVVLTSWELDTLLDMDSAAIGALNKIRAADAATGA